MRASIIAVSTLLLLVARPASSTTYHVAPDSSGDVVNIQAAIDAANSGDEIVLSDGIFTGDGNWELDFRSKDLVLRSEHGYEATYIHCGFESGWIYPSHRGIVLEGHHTSATRIEGITIQRIYGDYEGGAIRSVGGSPVIRSVRIQENRDWGRGGGIFVEDGSPVIEDCIFDQGWDYGYFKAGEGAAIFAQQSAVTITRCSFASYRTGYEAVRIDGGTVTDCTFRFIRAEDYPAVCLHVEPGRTVSILRCHFGPSFAVAIVALGEDLLVADCIFDDLMSDGGTGLSGYGRAIVRNSIFRAVESQFFSCAIDWASGTLSLDHCAFIDCKTAALFEGGVVSLYDAAATISHCTFVGSQSNYMGPSAITLRHGSALSMDHSIIAFGSHIGPPRGAVFCTGTQAIEITCTDIYHNAGGDWMGCIAGMAGANGNLSADPLFCNLGAGDLSLSFNSPCAPASSEGCGLIGMYGPWCGPLAVEPHSWGSIKAHYR